MDIVNIIVSGSFGHAIDLEYLSKVCDIFERQSITSGRGLLHLSSKKVMIFKSGKYTINGIKSLSQIDDIVLELKTILGKKIDISQMEYPNIRNIVAIDNMHMSINLIKLIAYLQDDNAEYEPEMFPGLVWKTKYGSVIIFQNGKIILLGSKSEEELILLRDFTVSQIIKIKKN